MPQAFRHFLIFAALALAGGSEAGLAEDAQSELARICADYDQSPTMIPMRDGVRLYTEIFRPKHNAKPTAILIDRTPYLATNPAEPCPSRVMALFDDVRDDGYILVRQSIRGRDKSEGQFVFGAPAILHDKDRNAIDELTDAWDTVDWLVKNVPGNNGKVALLGISYDAKLAMAAAFDPHPAVVTVSAQASPSDQWIGDDFWRNGALRLSWSAEQLTRMELSRTMDRLPFDTADTFDWYLNLGSLSGLDRYFNGRSPFWENEKRHPAHDEFWQARDLGLHLDKVRIPLLVTAGWWDAEDFYGAMAIAKGLENSKANHGTSRLVVGPWTHGGWSSPWHGKGRTLAKLDFGSDTALYWRHEVERPWLAHWLLGAPDPHLPAALSFRTGTNQWQRYDSWPPKTARGNFALYLRCDGSIADQPPARASCVKSYLSDPANPIPFVPRPIAPIGVPGSPWASWEAQDQRFSADRPDTVTFATAPLTEDIILTGEAELTLHIATAGSDGDFIVKLLDIYPGIDSDHPDLGGYRLMLNHFILAGRYLDDITRPKPMEPNHVYEMKFHFTGNDHAFLKGHRLALQVQSSLFPVIARNPQTYVADIFAAKPSDYVPAKIGIVFDPEKPNLLLIPRN